MDVSLCIVYWLQVVMNNGQEQKLKKKEQIQGLVLKRKKGELLWDNAFVHCKDLSLMGLIN